MKTFTPVPKIYFLLFVFILEYVNYVNCLNMWTSLEQKQAGNKSPSKKCVSPCRIFHTWCKNEGKCREKGRDCTWYCECPSDCEGFFCEKKVGKDIPIDAGQTVEVKVSYEKEKKKPVSAFDKSKLAQALAGIFLKEKRTDEEKKTVLPDTVERVGNTIETKENVTAKVILNCPPGELYQKAPGNNSTEKTTNQTTTIAPYNQTHSNTVTNTTMNISESTSNMTESTYSTTYQSRPRSIEKPIVSSSFSDTTVTKATLEIPTITQHGQTTKTPHSSVTKSPINETNSNVNVESTTANFNEIVVEKITGKPTDISISLKTIQTTPKSDGTSSQMSPRSTLNQLTSAITNKASSTAVPDDLITSTRSPAKSEVKMSTISKVQTEGKSILQHQTSKLKETYIKPAIISTLPKQKMHSTVKYPLTKQTTQKSSSEILSTLMNSTTSLPVKQFDKDSKAPAENSLYSQRTNVINIADKPNLMQIIEKAIEVEFITTTEKTTTKSSLNNKTTTIASMNGPQSSNVISTEKVHISKIPTTNPTRKQVSNDIDDVRTTSLPQTSSISAKTTSSEQKDTKNSFKHTNILDVNTSAQQSIANVLSKQNVSSPLYEQTTTNKPFTSTVATGSVNYRGQNSSSYSKMKEHTNNSNQDADMYILHSTTPTVERPIHDQKIKYFSETLDKTDFETTTIKTTITTTKNDAITQKARKSSNVDKISPSESSNDVTVQTVQTSTESVSGRYKSEHDNISTNVINRSSPTNVRLLNMSQVITVSHDLPKTTKLDMSTVQTIMSNEITPEQQNSKKLVENVIESTTSQPSTKQRTNKITTEGSVTTSSSATTTKSDIEKMTIEKKNINNKKALKFTTESSILNVSKETVVDSVSGDRSEFLKSTVKNVLSTLRPRFSETTTNANNNTSTSTFVSVPSAFTGDSTTHTSFNNPSTKRAITSRGVTKSFVNKTENGEKNSPQHASNSTENPAAEINRTTMNTTQAETTQTATTQVRTTQTRTTQTAIIQTGTTRAGTTQTGTTQTETSQTGTTMAGTTQTKTTKTGTIKKVTFQTGTTQTGTTQAVTTHTGATTVLENYKPTTESVIYSADVGESKLSLAKNILDNKSDILKKSKVKNGLLSQKLSETVNDLKFDLLKMGLRDKGLPSDIDNIL